jgi:hypothetical protein
VPSIRVKVSGLTTPVEHSLINRVGWRTGKAMTIEPCVRSANVEVRRPPTVGEYRTLTMSAGLLTPPTA